MGRVGLQVTTTSTPAPASTAAAVWRWTSGSRTAWPPPTPPTLVTQWAMCDARAHPVGTTPPVRDTTDSATRTDVTSTAGDSETRPSLALDPALLSTLRSQ